MNDVLKTRLTGRAARWLTLLRDYGHLDEALLDALFAAMADELGQSREALVDVHDVQRLAARLLFDRSPEGEDGTDVIAEDWSLLFY